MNDKLKAIVEGMVEGYGEEKTLQAIVRAEQRLRLQQFGGIENPWKRKTFNLSRQGEISQKDPDLAAILQEEAKE